VNKRDASKKARTLIQYEMTMTDTEYYSDASNNYDPHRDVEQYSDDSDCPMDDYKKIQSSNSETESDDLPLSTFLGRMKRTYQKRIKLNKESNLDRTASDVTKTSMPISDSTEQSHAIDAIHQPSASQSRPQMFSTEQCDPALSPLQRLTSKDVYIDQLVQPSDKELGTKKHGASRKRKHTPENWERNKLKKNRHTGKSYTTHYGKMFSEKKMKSGCGMKCRYKCHEKISNEDRLALFENYWRIGDKSRQREFLARCIKRHSTKRKTCSETSRRQHSHTYTFSKNSSDIQVCKVFFLGTLDVSDKVIQNVLNNVNTNGILDESRSGKHTNRRSTSTLQTEQVKRHIESFPTVPSHYCRKRTNRKYLPGHLNIRKMYQLYLNEVTEHPVSENMYRKIFSTDYNIHFWFPKKDQCERCVRYNLLSPADQLHDKDTHARHIANKVKVRVIKENEKQESLSKNDFSVACFDLEQVLECPHAEVGLLYYKRKLSVYNLSVYDIGTKMGYCYMWPETVAGRGSNEIMSCLLQYIKTKAEGGTTKLSIYSDKCSGQNRNRYIVTGLTYAVHHTGIATISHKFFESGHSQNENDSIHANIERSKKGSIVFRPEQYATLVSTARKPPHQPYQVVEITQNDVLNFKEVASRLKNFAKDSNGDKIRWMDLNEIKVEKSNPFMVYIKYNHDDIEYKSFDLLWRMRGPRPNITILIPSVLYSKPIPLSQKKTQGPNDLSGEGNHSRNLYYLLQVPSL
jgi:hypothetical protein